MKIDYRCRTDVESKAFEFKLRKWLAVLLLVPAVGIFFWQGSILSSSQEAQQTAERDRDEQLLRAELIIMSAPPAIIMCGKDHRITVANPSAEKLFGYSYKELIGKDVSILMPPKAELIHDAAFARAIKAVEASPDNHMMRRTGVSVTGKHKDGSGVPLVLSIRVIKYSGKIEFIASMLPRTREKPPPPDKIEHMPIPNIKRRAQQARQVYRK